MVLFKNLLLCVNDEPTHSPARTKPPFGQSGALENGDLFWRKLGKRFRRLAISYVLVNLISENGEIFFTGEFDDLLFMLFRPTRPERIGGVININKLGPFVNQGLHFIYISFPIRWI